MKALSKSLVALTILTPTLSCATIESHFNSLFPSNKIVAHLGSAKTINKSWSIDKGHKYFSILFDCDSRIGIRVPLEGRVNEGSIWSSKFFYVIEDEEEENTYWLYSEQECYEIVYYMIRNKRRK